MHAIGIDMSKASFHAALDEGSVKKFSNSPEGIEALLAHVAARCAPKDATVAVESTGVYHLLLCITLSSAGCRVMIINPLESHRFSEAQSLRRRKTDAVDAQVLRTMAQLGLGRLFTETSEVLTLKALVTERDGLVDMLTTLKQHREARTVRRRALAAPLYDPSPSVMIALQTSIGQIEAQFLNYAPETQSLLRSIPGIGPVSAALLVAYIGDIRRFSSPEKLVAYVGLDCRVHQSGTSINGRGYISKRGNHRLRRALFNAAFIARQHNPALKAYFDKKTAEGKHYLSALIAVERKLIHLIFAVWSRGTPFESRA